jgi:hypothetical protein
MNRLAAAVSDDLQLDVASFQVVAVGENSPNWSIPFAASDPGFAQNRD